MTKFVTWLKLLLYGIKANSAYSSVIVLIIAALFSTPLVLGSIKNKVST
jgi:hypothetical protein